MSRWETLPSNPTNYIQNAALPQNEVGQMNNFNMGNDVFQHGTIGNFIGSNLEGAGSGFIRCVYTAKNTNNATVTLLCEKTQGCCQNGCCPKDQFWMAGVFVLLGFVLLVFVVGACTMIICYWRSKSNQRRDEKENYEYNSYGSQVGMYPSGYPPYGSAAPGSRF